MTNISRRIRRLEEVRFGNAADNEFARRLLERMAEGRRRVAEAKKQHGELWGPNGDDDAARALNCPCKTVKQEG